MCCGTRRCIDKAGGLDAYILNTPDEKLGSDVGAELRKEMLAAKMVPPPQRRPRAAQQPAQPGSQEHIGQQLAEAAPG
jgi:large subunit ribosomal protein L28